MDNSTSKTSTLNVVFYAILALVAFAGNSILCRFALDEGSIDAASFTSLRLISGALVLALILKLSSPKTPIKGHGSWASATALFFYAASFSFAYNSLQTGTGALLLFGAVQLTMIIAALLSGERLRVLEFAGAVLAFAGLIYLVSPGISAPPLTGALLMAGAGISWGIYCLRGRSIKTPLAETTINFALTLPFVVILNIFSLQKAHLSLTGVTLAILSGSITSGIGYAVWYAALRGMTATTASIIQLTVPVLASLGGVIFLSEDISIRFIISTATIIGGVGLAVTGDKFFVRIQA